MIKKKADTLAAANKLTTAPLEGYSMHHRNSPQVWIKKTIQINFFSSDRFITGPTMLKDGSGSLKLWRTRITKIA